MNTVRNWKREILLHGLPQNTKTYIRCVGLYFCVFQSVSKVYFWLFSNCVVELKYIQIINYIFEQNVVNTNHILAKIDLKYSMWHICTPHSFRHMFRISQAAPLWSWEDTILTKFKKLKVHDETFLWTVSKQKRVLDTETVVCRS